MHVRKPCPHFRGFAARVPLPEALLAAVVLAALAPSSLAQLQFDELGKRALPPDHDPTSSAAFGDVEGDGDLDLVLGNYGQSRLYLNDGSGIFTDATAAHMPVDNEPTQAVVLGDVDGDGDLDLVLGNGSRFPWVGPRQSRLYLNDGTGTFTDATAARMPVDNDITTSLALGDVDGDGDLDLVLGNTYGQSRLYLNNGSGTFTDATAARMPVDNDRTQAVVLGDVDGDGDLDLVLGNYGQQSRLYLNDGTGTFTDATAARMPVDSDPTSSAAFGDVEGDGDLDLVLGNYGQSRLYLNDGSGTFTDATAVRMPVRGDNTTCLALADVDRDGGVDFAFGNSRQRNRLYFNDGRGTFADATATRLPVDNDAARAVAFADADGDRDLDLVTGNYGQSRLALNDGRGTFIDATAARLPVGSYATYAVAVGDVDGDGDLDLVFGNSGQSRLYSNDSRGTFTDVTAARMPVRIDNTYAVALGDVDGDRDLDLVIGNSGQSRLYLNDGTGKFTDATAARMPLRSDNTRAVAFGDVDGDGDLDLVLGNYGGRSRLYLNSGRGTFTDATAERMPVDRHLTRAVACGDVDADGDLDLVFGNEYDGDRLYLNNGSGTFADVTAARMPVSSTYTYAVALGDVDGDADLDLVFGDGGSGYVQRPRLYLNDGRGTFTDVTATRVPASNNLISAVALADVDGDGDLDLVLGNDLGQQDRLYLNLLRQLDAPFLLRVGRTYPLDVYARYGPVTAGTVALAFLSPATANIPLPPLGIVGIDPNRMVPLPTLLIPPASGVSSIAIAVPNNPGFAGVPIYGQALLVPNPFQRRLTNVNGDVVWR